jgi:anaerobic selenocysteine-containing dehydrogenase
MKNKRRDFLKLSGLAGAGMILGTGPAISRNLICMVTPLPNWIRFELVLLE